MSFRKVLSLTLVMAVLVTSMMVSSVGAATSTNPMQLVLMEAAKMSYTQKGQFVDELIKLEQDQETVAQAATAIVGLFGGKITQEDAEAALTKYDALDSTEQFAIRTNISAFQLNSMNYSGNEFDTIVEKINSMLTGETVNDGNKHDGVSLVFQGIQYLNSLSENGAYVTDLASNTAKIDFAYKSGNALVDLAAAQISVLIEQMETLNSKLTPYSGTAFEKLLSYAEDTINNDSSISSTEIAKLKEFIDDINPNYYIPYSAPVIILPTPTPTPSTDLPEDTAAQLEELNNEDSDLSGSELKELQKQVEAAFAAEIAKVATVAVTPTVVGDKATVAADQIKVDEVIAKAEAAIAKAADLAKAAGDAKVDVEKKVVIDVGSTEAASVSVGLTSELLTKVQEKGIEKIEIATGDVKLNIAPDFVKEAKDSKSVTFEINKVAVTDELKAQMSDEQKALLNGNVTVLDFNAAVVSAEGTETKVSKFNKPITIKVKYTLKASENKDKITVLYLADDGSVKNMVGRYDEATGEVVFETKHFSNYVVKNVVKKFNDVSSGAWYKTQAESLAAKGITSGVGGNKFGPDTNITRAEFITMLVKATGTYDETSTASFSDVSEDDWYYGYVASAVKAGIAGGVGNGKFAPERLITREQMAAMIANIMDETIDNAGSYLKASDASKISSFAKNAMALCAKNEFLVGNNNKLDPQGKASRAMAAVVVYKYFNYVY